MIPSRRTSPQWCYWTGERSLSSSNHEAYSRKFHLAFIRPKNVVPGGPRVLWPSETQPIYVRYGGRWSIFLDSFQLTNYPVSQIQDDFQRYLCHAFGLNKKNSFFHTGTNEKRGGFSSVWQKAQIGGELQWFLTFSHLHTESLELSHRDHWASTKTLFLWLLGEVHRPRASSPGVQSAVRGGLGAGLLEPRT